MENLVLIDWLSITSKIHTPEELISLLGMTDCSWEDIKGAHGYRDRKYYNCISIHYNGRPEMGVWLEMSGQGCRCFETVGHGNYEMIFKMVLSKPNEVKITRLDLAFDDHSGILPMDVIVQDTINQNYIAKAQYWETVLSSKGSCVFIGSPQSPVRIRIYDKARERNCEPGTHWIRVEIQLRDERALEFLKTEQIAVGDKGTEVYYDLDIGERFCGVLLNYLRYVTPSDDENKSRWPMTEYWQNLITFCIPISIYSKPGIEYNLSRAKDFVFRLAGNPIDALIQVYGVDGFLSRLQARKTKPNPKYKSLVDDFHNGVYDKEIKGEIDNYVRTGVYIG